MQSRIGMKPRASVGIIRIFTLMSLLCPVAFAASTPKEPPGKMVDAGSFGVFMNGQRVATETFSIHQDDAGSSILSEFKTEAGMEKAAQNSDLQLDPKGELKSYDWKETSPGDSHASVLPAQDFLTERFSKTAQEKPHEQPFLLPASTTILDDYFLIQREVLAWKFLATTCKQEKGQISCPLKQSVQIGTLNPHTRQSMPVGVQYSGRETVSIHNSQRELIRLDVTSEVGNWALWLDDQLKLQRILDLGGNTEVLRD